MQYEEWLNILEELKTSSTNIDTLKRMQNADVNPNFNNMLVPKLEELIRTKFNYSIEKIIKNLGDIFSDINYLDLTLLNFKKEINYVIELSKLKQLPPEKQIEIQIVLKTETNKVYDILCTEADKIDYTGGTSIIIKNNRIKWSE